MGYWRKFYTEYIGNKDFVEGLIAGVETYAIWKNGNQYVGIRELPLKEVIKEIKEDLLPQKGE